MSIGQEPVPFIPEGFPREFLPENICEKELLYLNHCSQMFESISYCSEYLTEFKECKRQRDFSIFESIRKWQLSSFRGLNDQSK